MKAWEFVINTAMLGTDKPAPALTDAGDDVANIAAMIDAAEALDKEEKFLQKAAVIYNYLQCGFSPQQQKGLPVTVADEESQSYCSTSAQKVLNSILQEDNNSLLEFWLGLCKQHGQILWPDDLPAVLHAGLKEKALQPLIVACRGNRGAWLATLNPYWNYYSTLSDEEVWQTGNPEERVIVLSQLRETDPAQALEWLQQTWAQETAASKVELLRTLRINAGTADIQWLESLLTEKGQKVKDEALALLKLIPGSAIINQYQDLLARSVILKKEKALFGMMNKVSIQQKLPDTVDESIFKSGIQKLAGQKASHSDESFILYQLILEVPPSFWEKQFDATPIQVVEYFEKYANDKVPALALAVARFKSKEWIPYLLSQPMLHTDFLPMMAHSEREKYLARFLREDPQNTIHHALREHSDWGADFALQALSAMANHPYEYNKVFFSKNINAIPIGVTFRLEGIGPKDANLQNAWEKAKQHLIKLLGLKQQALQAFNA